MEDLNIKLLVEYLYEYSEICKQQQATIGRMQKYILNMQNKDKTNSEVTELHKEVDRLTNELEIANRDKYKAFETCEKLNDQIEVLLEKIESLRLVRQDEISERLNGQKSKVSEQSFLEAYELTKDLDSLADLFNVQTQTIRNYIKRYVKE